MCRLPAVAVYHAAGDKRYFANAGERKRHQLITSNYGGAALLIGFFIPIPTTKKKSGINENTHLAAVANLLIIPPVLPLKVPRGRFDRFRTSNPRRNNPENILPFYTNAPNDSFHSVPYFPGTLKPL